MKTVILNNGLSVVNFSSNHSAFNPNSNVAFTFEDGNTLENVDIETNKRLSMEVIDETFVNKSNFTEVRKGFKLTNIIISELEKIQEMQHVDIIIVPFPMLLELTKQGLAEKCFTCELNRQTKVCSTSRFCKV